MNRVKATVYFDEKTGNVTYKLGVMDRKHGTAYGYFDNTLNDTGWDVLEIQTKQPEKFSATANENLMFAAGYLEGVLTAK